MLPGRLRNECWREGMSPGNTWSRVLVNKARQRLHVPPQLLEKDFVARLCGPQQGATIILSALSSARVFLLPQSVT